MYMYRYVNIAGVRRRRDVESAGGPEHVMRAVVNIQGERERERETDRQTDRQTEKSPHPLITP